VSNDQFIKSQLATNHFAKWLHSQNFQINSYPKLIYFNHLERGQQVVLEEMILVLVSVQAAS
jgi:hypothetical protein